MSQVEPCPTRETVEATPRLAMSPARRKRIFGLTAGLCSFCDEKATEIDHEIPLWLGGEDEDDNCQPLCVTHHARKTAHDAAIRAKVKRLIAQEAKAPPKGRMLRSQGFRKDLRRRMNGVVEKRAPHA